ncbi:MAG: MFS transporter [Magnetococcales bacterium]|nr:MFS transporter [Magnetococcales bacterium]
MTSHSLLRSLAHRNFRLFFFGHGVSLIGTWMQQVALSWLVFQLTGSSLQLGLVLFLGQIPALFLSPFIGVWMDRWNRHRVILLTQTLAMTQAFLLAWLEWSGTIAVWQIWPLSLFLGIVNAFDITARQTFIHEMVDRPADLGNAIALNSSLFNAARLVGPAIAGLLLTATTPGVCFLSNGLSYLAVLTALLAMRLPPHIRKTQPGSVRASLCEGVAYALGHAVIRNILSLIALSGVAGISYVVLLPELTTRILHGTASTLGWLVTSAGSGALCGALLLASRKNGVNLGKWIALGPAITGTGLVLLPQATDGGVAVVTLVAIGFGIMVQIAASNTIIQTVVDEDKRGRVMSFYAMAFTGMAPVGHLLTGYLSAVIGPMNAFRLNGCLCLLGSLLFTLWLPRLRERMR